MRKSKSKYAGKYFKDTSYGDLTIFKVISYSKNKYGNPLQINPRFRQDKYCYVIEYLYVRYRGNECNNLINTKDRMFRQELNSCKEISKDEAMLEVL